VFFMDNLTKKTKCNHEEIGREVIGGFLGHEHRHTSGEQLCLNCGMTLKEIMTKSNEEYLDDYVVWDIKDQEENVGYEALLIGRKEHAEEYKASKI